MVGLNTTQTVTVPLQPDDDRDGDRECDLRVERGHGLADCVRQPEPMPVHPP